MDKNQTTATSEDLNKSVDLLVDELFAEPVAKSQEGALNIAGDASTTADKALASVPASGNDNSNPGRPKQMHTMSEGGDSSYDSKIASPASEQENEEAKKQSKDVSQLSSNGRLSKSISEEEYTEFMTLKKADDQRKANEAALKKADDLRKSEELQKAQQNDIIQKAVSAAVAVTKKENDELRKSFTELQTLTKAILAQPQAPKSVTSIESLEKSMDPSAQPTQTEFSKAEKLDAAESLFKSGKLPIDAVIELENTGTVYNKQWQDQIATELQKN